MSAVLAWGPEFASRVHTFKPGTEAHTRDSSADEAERAGSQRLSGQLVWLKPQDWGQ